MQRARSAVFTLASLAAAWLSWTVGERLAGWAGYEDMDILVQVACVFAGLAAAEKLLSLPTSGEH